MRGERRGKFETLGVSLLALLLAGLVLRHTFAGYLAKEHPETALWFNSSSVEALLNIADRKLNGSNVAEADAGEGVPSRVAPSGGTTSGAPSGAGLAAPLAKIASDAIQKSSNEVSMEAILAGLGSQTEEDRKEIRGLAERALRIEPINARALRILGQIAIRDDDAEKTKKFMERALKASLRESVAALWLLDYSDKKKDYAKVAEYADILLRTRREAAAFAIWKLAQLAENKDANDVVKKLLAENPPWRASFFSSVVRYITDARTPLELLLSLRKTPTPPTQQELASYANFLVGKKFYEIAYYTYLQFLPPGKLASVGLLENGQFEEEPSGSPFDWSLAQGKGASARITPRSNQSDQNALEIEFGLGRVAFRGVYQLTMLAPGTYELTGKYKGKLTGRRGLVWRAYCASTNKLLGESEMIMASEREWKPFNVRIEVLDQDCRAQKVHLELAARSASETLISGRMQFDDLSLMRQPK